MAQATARPRAWRQQRILPKWWRPNRLIIAGLVALRDVLTRYWPFALPLIAGLFLRLAVIPPSIALDLAPFIADEGNYVGIAESLAAGYGIPDRWAWLRPPGYPLFLAGLLRLVGSDLRAPLLAQAVVGIATVLFLALLAGRLWGRRAALGAAWWTALDPSLVYYTRILHAETLYTAFLVLAALALVAYAAPGATWRPLAVGAVAIGLAALVRPSIVTVIPFLALWVALRRRRSEAPGSRFKVQGWARGTLNLERGTLNKASLGHALLLLLLVAAVIAPNAARNWAAYDRFIPLDTTLGYIFWLDHRDVSKQELVATLSAIPNPGDRQAYALRQGLAWVVANPGETVKRTVSNLRVIWGDGVYVADALGKRRGVSDGWRYTIEALGLLTWLLLVPLAIVGASRARRLDPLVPIILIAVLTPTIGVGLSHPENRYMLPSLPLLIALAAGVLAPRDAAARSWRRRGAAVVVIALFLLNCWLIAAPEGRSRLALAGHWLLARGAEQVGATDIAREHYAAMLGRDRRLSEPDERLAALARGRGDVVAATALALAAVERDGDNFRARDLAAQLLREQGDLAGARQLAARTGQTTPDALDWAWGRTPTVAPASLALDGDDVGYVRGFYGLERGEGGRAFRWMADHGQVRLAPPANARTLVLTLASPRPPEAYPLFVSVRVNGRPLGTAAVRRDLGWNEIRLSLPATLAPTRPLTVELRATTIRLPGDRRALGVAVARVAVEVGSGQAAGGRGETRGALGGMLSPIIWHPSYFRLRPSYFILGGAWIGRIS